MAAAERVERAEIENVFDRLEVWHRGEARADDDSRRRSDDTSPAER